MLGYPTSDVGWPLNNGGKYQLFQGGAIVWSPATGAHESTGPIRAAWQSTGFENGRLGYPPATSTPCQTAQPRTSKAARSPTSTGPSPSPDGYS